MPPADSVRDRPADSVRDRPTDSVRDRPTIDRDRAVTDPSERLPAQPADLDLEGIDIDILENGTVRLHATCQPGQDPRECARKMRFLVEALGIPMESVVTDLTVP